MLTHPPMRVYLVLIGAILIWSTAYPAISAAVRVYTPIEMAAFRMLVGGCAILLLTLAYGKRVLPGRRDILPSVLCGVIGFASYNLALGFGQQHITAGESSLLVALAPVFTVLAAALFLREKIAGQTWVGIAVSFSGVAVMALTRQSGIGLDWGALIILYAALTQALLTLLQKEMLKRHSPLEVTCFCIQSAVLATLPFGWTAFPKALAEPFSEATLALVYLALVSLVLGYLGWAYVLHHLSAAKAVSFMYCIPVGATVVGYFWLGEMPGVATFIGGAVALMGVAVVNYRRTRSQAELPPPLE